MKHKQFKLFIAFALFIFACNLPAGNAPPDEGEIFTQAALTITAAAQQLQPTSELNLQLVSPQAPTATESAANPTATQPPPTTAAVTNTPVCNLASFVSDVTIKDNEAITVGKAFTKTWKLRNVGSCTWTSGYQIIFDSGDKMGGPDSQQLTNGTVAPGQTIDVSVNLTAPASPGTYKGNWKLKDPNGVIFALSTGPFWVQIKAVAAPQADWTVFKNGDTGPEVYAIQYLLQAHGYQLNADGIFGPQTQARVEDFQTDNNLSEDIIVGPETWQKLIIQVSQGKTGTEVRAVQHLLKNKFGYNIGVDGIFGPETFNAVKQFQTSKGLTSDGIVGPNTWKALVSK